MSGSIGAQVRTLPFTGITALPFIIVGLILTLVGFAVTLATRVGTR
jgi:hypothetical protein